MLKPLSCQYLLKTAWKKIIEDLPFPYKYKSDYAVQYSSVEWCKVVVVTKENKNGNERTFRMAFRIFFPQFPFYYKPYADINVSELNTAILTGDKRICRELQVKLPDLRGDIYILTGQTEDSVTHSLDKKSNEANVRYILDKVKVAYELLNSI